MRIQGLLTQGALCSFLVGLIFFVSSSCSAGWSPARLLNDPAETSTKGAEIWPASDGGFHAVYSNTSPWQIVYRRYKDGILSPRQVIRTGFVPNPNLCQAGNGDVHLVWEDWDDSLQIGWAVSKNRGASFLPWQEITNTGDTKWPLIVPFGPPDSPTVIMSFWQAKEKNLYWRVYDGTSWGPLVNMNQNADNEYEVFGMCRSLQDGTVYRSYGTKIGGVLSVCFRRFNGSYWEPQVVAGSPGFFCRHGIAVNTIGHVLVMWEQDERVWTRIYTPGVGWGPIERITNESSGFGDVTAVPTATDFYLVYRRAGQIWGRRWQGGTWKSEELVSVGMPDGFVVDADVCAGADGTLYASWEYWGTGEPQQWFSIREGNPIPDAVVRGYVRDQYGQGIPNVSVGSGAYVTVSTAGGFYSLGVPSGTRSFTASKTGYVGQTLENVVVPANGAVNLDFTITAIPVSAPSGFKAMPSNKLVRLVWTNPTESWFQGTIVRCKTSGYPTSPDDGIFVCDRQNVPGSSDSYVHSGLTNGVTYYYAAFAYDWDRHYSAPALAQAVPVDATCSYVKSLSDGWLVDLYSRVVSANFASTDGCIYIQDPEGVSGVRVATTQSGFSPGDVVNVSGQISSRFFSGYRSERVLTDAAISKIRSGSAPKPVGMKCGAVGGGPAGLMVPGVRNGVGLNNIGLLVRIAGKVTYKSGSYIYVDDGSDVPNLFGLSTPVRGVMVKCPGTPSVNVGDLVGVTGVVVGSIPSNPEWTTNRAFIQMRDWADLVRF